MSHETRNDGLAKAVTADRMVRSRQAKRGRVAVAGRWVGLAGLCIIAGACSADPPPALLTMIEPERMALQDSELLPDSAKAAIRSYLSRVGDDAWGEVTASPDLDRLVGEFRGLTALLNQDALPGPGQSAAVMVDVPDIGFTEFRVERADGGPTPTYVGQAKRGAMSFLLLQDSIIAGRITTVGGVFNFRSGRYGLINVAPLDTTRSLPELHLTRPSGAAPRTSGTRTAAAFSTPFTG
jgi:hypothetical protein